MKDITLFLSLVIEGIGLLIISSLFKFNLEVSSNTALFLLKERKQALNFKGEYCKEWVIMIKTVFISFKRLVYKTQRF